MLKNTHRRYWNESISTRERRFRHALILFGASIAMICVTAWAMVKTVERAREQAGKEAR